MSSENRFQTAFLKVSVFGASRGTIGIGLDSCVVPVKNDAYLVQTVDYFYALIDDPYLMGRITAANVLSDLYAMGVAHCDNMLMILSLPTTDKLKSEHAQIVSSLIMRGFRDAAKEAQTEIRGGQTIYNPWLTLGGVATSVCAKGDLIMPDGAEPGDVLVLTKPLGTQVAVNAFQWLSEAERFDKIRTVITREEVILAYRRAADSMARLNRVGAILMQKYSAHAATDVTGFGILGHALNLAAVQKARVDFVLHTLPVIRGMAGVARAAGSIFGLVQGYSAETSGGLLIAMTPQAAQEFISEIAEREARAAWVVGRVESGSGSARMAPELNVLEVPAEKMDGSSLW